MQAAGSVGGPEAIRKPSLSGTFAFGPWRVEPARGLLTSEAGEVRVEPRLMDLLVLFAASNGRVIGKDEIIASVWQGRAVGDDTLAAAISRLRSALGATPGQRFIETIPKRGYRLALAEPVAVPATTEESGAGRLLAQGAAMLASGAPAGLPQARLYFEAAIAADPGSAPAQAGLAQTLFTQHLMNQDAGPALLPLARAAALAATGLDESLAQAWTLRGYGALIVEHDFAAADRDLLRAIALDPEAGAPHRYRAIALAAAGRMVEAERESRRACELEPLSLAARGWLLQILLVARRYAQARDEAKAVIALAPSAGEAWYAMGWALKFLGREAEAVEAMLKGLALWGLDEAALTPLRRTYDTEGFAALCAAAADLYQGQRLLFAVRPTDLAALRAMAGQTDLAFAALEDAVARDDPYLLLLEQMPWFDGLNNDPRWRPLAERARPVR